MPTPSKHPQDRIEHGIQVLAYVLGKKAQHEVAVLLQQLVLPSVATVRDRIREVLSAIKFDGYTRVGAQQVDSRLPEYRDREDRRRALGNRQRFEDHARTWRPPVGDAAVRRLV
jgi:hypothetical protein